MGRLIGKHCKQCKRYFEATDINQIFCSKECRKKYRKEHPHVELGTEEEKGSKGLSRT